VIVVTGASGFVGGAIARGLTAHGLAVRGWYRTAPGADPSLEWARVNLAAPLPAGCLAACELLVHAAGIAHARPTPALAREIERVNVEGTRRLLAAAEAAGVTRVILLSSVKAQGAPAPGTEGDESAEPRPEGEYGRAKLAAETLLREWSARTGGEGIALRLPLVYGPGAKGNFARMLRAAARGWIVTIGDGSARRSLVSRDAVAHAVRTILRSPPRPGFRVYIVADEQPYTVLEMQEALGRAFGRRPRRVRLPLGLAHALASIGDAGQRLWRRPLPWSGEVLARLTEEARYSAAAFRRDYGWHAPATLAEAAPAIVGAVPAGEARNRLAAAVATGRS
jgi:nucleoside-diphosphate-sugar epimerase